MSDAGFWSWLTVSWAWTRVSAQSCIKTRVVLITTSIFALSARNVCAQHHIAGPFTNCRSHKKWTCASFNGAPHIHSFDSFCIFLRKWLRSSLGVTSFPKSDIILRNIHKFIHSRPLAAEHYECLKLWMVATDPKIYLCPPKYRRTWRPEITP